MTKSGSKKNEYGNSPGLDEETKINYRRWINYEYINRTIQHSSPMNNFIRNNLNFEYGSSIARDFTSRYLNNDIWINLNTVITAFKLRDTSELNKNAIIYGFLYTTVGGIEKEIEHDYFCCGPSLLSRDGEYRQRISLYSKLADTIKIHKKLWDVLEDYVMLKLKNQPWNYFTEYFYPTVKQQTYDKKIVSNINKERIPIKFLIISWFTELFNIMNKIPVNHINKLYLNIMGFLDKKIMAKDIKFYNDIKKSMGISCILSLRHYLHVLRLGSEAGALKLGQKLIPLNMSEVQHPFNVKYKPWREFLISKKVQDLIINGICKGFPFIGDYFYVKDIRKTLFDNYVQYMRLEHSELATYIARQLVEAQRATYETIKSADALNLYATSKDANRLGGFKNKTSSLITQSGEKIKKIHKESKNLAGARVEDVENIGDSMQEIEWWLSEKFRQLHKKIDDPIEYAKDEIIMSDVAFCVLSEFVGRTFYDFLLINRPVEGSDVYIKETGNPLKNYHIWAKYIYEIIYDLLCINMHVGVIHGDLHLNNATIHPMFYREYKDVRDLKRKNIEPYMLYVLKSHYKSEEEVVFGFPSTQYHSCLIDFGRSIVRPSMINNLKDSNIIIASHIKLSDEGEIELLGKDDDNKFYKEQVIRILNILEHYFPEMYIKNKNQLELAIFQSLEELFPILTAIDIYRFTTEVTKYLKSKKIKMNKTKQFALIKKIKSKAESIICDKLIKVINDSNLLELDEYKTFANWEIINECFSDFIVMSTYENEWKNSNFVKSIKDNNKTIIDVSFLHNDIKFSLDHRERNPEFLKYRKIMNKNGKITTYHMAADKEMVLAMEKDKGNNLKIISMIAKRHKEKYI